MGLKLITLYMSLKKVRYVFQLKILEIGCSITAPMVSPLHSKFLRDQVSWLVHGWVTLSVFIFTIRYQDYIVHL